MSENRLPALSPMFGLRIFNRDVPSPHGFTPDQLDAVYADLATTAHEYGMLMESASFTEVDAYYNPGQDEVPAGFVLEAIVVERFSATEHRMAAVVRVFNRFLSGTEIKALPPIVGKPRKTGTYAYVTVQIPFSDGQTVSVIFHSPEGDKKKIAPSDTIIAFQWLLNRRDITHVVAPENGSEISLDELAKKITQLVVKNSARFERMQKGAAEERKLLDDTRKAVDDAEDKQHELLAAITTISSERKTVDAKLSNTLALLEKQKTINAELQAKLDALEKARENGAGDKSKNIDELFAAMLKEAARWRGAVMKAARIVKDDKSTAMAVMRMTTKGDLDAYLMKKFGVDQSVARDVSNTLTARNIPDDMTAEISDFADEEWAKLATKQKPVVVLELPVTAFRPEEMRVAFEDEKYLVQTRRDGGEWITQKIHSVKEAAISDAQSWYPETGDGADSELKRPDRQEEPFAAFLDGYSSKTTNPYLLTSDMSDAFVLGRYFAQQGYELPKIASKSRGDTWRVVMNSSESTETVEAVFSVNGETVKSKSGPAPRKDAETYGVGSLEKKIASLLSEVAAKGITVPSPVEFMADVEAGRRVGKRKAAIAQDLKEHKKDLAGLKSGTVAARKVLGAGGKKDMAEAWLLLEINACYTALENGTGFRCTANMGNYARMLNDALEGKDISALTDEGKDISALTDRQVAEEQDQRAKETQAKTAELLELENKARQMKNYSVGSLEGMKRPFEVKFTIQGDAMRTIVELGELATPQEKYEFLRDKAQSKSSLVGMETVQFNLLVELNGALRNGNEFGHFAIQPRTGYCVATCTIDLSGTSNTSGGKAAIDSLAAVITTIATPFPGRNAPWIIMNAPRPIRGHETQDGEFIHGRLFAAIDTSKPDAAAMMEENRKLDAKIIESVDMETAIKIGLSQIPEQYRETTEKMLADADKADATRSMLLDKIPSAVTHGEASALILKARSIPSPQREHTLTQPQAEPGFVVTLRDILSGKYDTDTNRMGSLLDAAADEAEKAGAMEQHEALFNQAADHLTAMLKKRAA